MLRALKKEIDNLEERGKDIDAAVEEMRAEARERLEVLDRPNAFRCLERKRDLKRE